MFYLRASMLGRKTLLLDRQRVSGTTMHGLCLLLKLVYIEANTKSACINPLYRRS